MEVYLIYVKGGWLPGVPARDLSYEEAKRYGISRLLESGRYVKAKSTAKPNPSNDKSLKGPSEDKGE